MAFSERQAAVKFLGYINSLITIDKLVEDDMLETYLLASSYFRKIFNSKNEYDTEEDMKILGCLHNAKPIFLGTEEISGVTGFSKRSLSGRLFNLTSRGYISVKTEKIEKQKRVLYSITPYGEENYEAYMTEKIAKIQNS